MNYKKLIPYYIKHLKKGLSEASFGQCDYNKLEEFAKNENLYDKIEDAKRDALRFWEILAINALSDNWENFKTDLDADGILLCAFDVPGKSMNWIVVVPMVQ